jgi:hypothetical protein
MFRLIGVLSLVCFGVMLVGCGGGGGSSSDASTTTSTSGTADAGERRIGAVKIVTDVLPDARAGEPYTFQFEAWGGGKPYHWEVWGFMGPPPGLSLSTDGVLKGTPTQPGVHPFGVRVIDVYENSDIKQFELVALTVNSPLNIVTEIVPDGIVGRPYSVTLEAEGGVRPYTWSLTGIVAGPPGLSVMPDGTVSGTPTESGYFQLMVQVMDGRGNTDTHQYWMNVYEYQPRPVTISTTSIPTGYEGVKYSVQLEAVGGQPPYTWKIYGILGLPAGMSLSETGELYGVPQAGGDYPVNVQVTDDRGSTAEAQFWLRVLGRQ